MIAGEGVPAEKTVLAKEVGLARYERIQDHDWSAGDDYWARTQPFWAVVRDAWAKSHTRLLHR